LPYRSGIAWLLVAVFCLQSLVFWGLSTWLPDAYVERGWDPGAAANLVASLIIVGLPTSLATGWLADRFGSRRHYLVGSSVVALVCCIGFVVLPDAGLLWAALIGVPLGALFPIAMTLPLDASARPADVGGLTAMMLGVGYIAAAAAPVAMGAARDVIGSFTASLTLLVVAAAALTVLSILTTDARLASGRTAGLPADREPVRSPGAAVEEL
jgi:CP family cyanate transporter-like MFS transporter